MAADKQKQSNNLSHWLIALALIMLIPLLTGFNGRLAIIRQMHQEELQLTQAMAEEQARRAELEELHAYVKSNAYVEYWARVEARMVRPGEVAVIPVAQEATPTPVPPTPSPNPPVSPPGEWWNVFFDPPANP